MKPVRRLPGGSHRFLEPDEVVGYASSPHPLELAGPMLVGALVLAAVVAGFVAWSSAPVWFGLVLAAVLVLDALVLGTRVAAHRSRLLMVTSLRIVHRQGVLRRQGRELPISRVEDVVYVQSIPGRLFRYGTLTVESAGAAPATPLRYVRAPEQVQHEIHRSAEAARLLRGRQVAEPPPAHELAYEPAYEPAAAPAPPVPSASDHLALLEALYRRGIVSEAELEEKRAELLGRT